MITTLDKVEMPATKDLILCILLRSLGIWQPLVRCLPCTGYTEKLDFLRDDFSHLTPGMVSVLNTPRFDSGYILGVSLRSLLEEFPSYFNAVLGSTADTSLCVRLRRLVLLVTMHLALYSFVVLRPQMLVITTGMDQKECYVSPCRKLRIFPQLQFLAGRAVHPVVAQWLCLTVQTAAGPRDSPVIDVPVVQVERDPHMPSWRRQSCSHGCTVVSFVLRSSSSSR